MSVSSEIRELVRKRAKYACEYCGVKEEDSASILTIDHYMPQSKGGSDSPSNLVYCCFRCNSHKHDYYPSDTFPHFLWNPRQELFEKHFQELESGFLNSLTTIGEFTIEKLKLNRKPLVNYRKKANRMRQKTIQLKLYEELILILAKQNEGSIESAIDQAKLIKEVKETRSLIYRILKNKKGM